jgi:hypothetical protein
MRAALLSTLLGILPVALLAHGEDKLGPHGGYIRMPGGFHTEIKAQDKELSIYLLDINWKNPTVKNSSVNVDYVNKDRTSALKCSSRVVNFSCLLPDGFKSNEGKLLVVAEREGVKGAIAEYLLPLKLIKPGEPTKEEDDHSKHR